MLVIFIFVFIGSCNPINISTQSEQQNTQDLKNNQIKTVDFDSLEKKTSKNVDIEHDKNAEKINIKKDITIIFSNKNNQEFVEQFINVLELAVYNKKLKNVSFEIKFFEDKKDLLKIIDDTKKEGKIYIGPIITENTKVVRSFCEDKVIFFSFSSSDSVAGDCIYLFNFFPKNELEQLIFSLKKDSKLALLYPENDYGYKINSLIDNVLDESDVILVNRSSYKKDLSNVRDSIKELGKYELRKYELDRQKKILSKKNDNQSKDRLKKLQRFKTTSDYDFSHILIADYGINLLKVAPLLPYYDIDPNVVQFLSTGVIDDENFFFEPSLQGTIFPGIEKSKRNDLLVQYQEIYEENLLRISTLSYDLVGLLNFIYSRQINYMQTKNLLNSSTVQFDGVDGKFYFKDNKIERDLDILIISKGLAKKIN